MGTFTQVFSRRTAAIICGVALMLAAAACGGSNSTSSKDGGDDGEKASDRKMIVIGTSGDFPPYEFRDDDGKVIGFIPDMLEAVLPKLGYDYKFVQISFSGLPAALESGRIDMITALYESPERLEAMDFASFAAERKSIIVRTEDAPKIKSWTDMCGKTIGVIIGSPILPGIVEEGSKEGCVGKGHPPVKMANYQSVAQELRDVSNGRIQAGLEGVAVFGHIVAENPGEFATAFTSGDPAIVGWALKKGSPLAEDMAKGLEGFLTDPEAVGPVQKKWHLLDGFFMPHVKSTV